MTKSSQKHIHKLKDLWLKSALHIEDYGHYQNHMWSGKACCIMGAPRMIDNESSYSHISRHLLADMGYPETWNDEPGRTKEEVIEALIKCSQELTEDHLESTFGPRWLDIVEAVVNVDSWDQSAYTDVEAKNPAPSDIEVDDYYTKALASFLGTVMTSEKTTKSTPFKNHFDAMYKEFK